MKRYKVTITISRTYEISEKEFECHELAPSEQSAKLYARWRLWKELDETTTLTGNYKVSIKED